MESFSEATLSAYFPGLVDVCLDDEGQPVYAILKDGELQITREYSTEQESYIVPEKKHFPFALPRASEILRHYKQDDTPLYHDLLDYLKRFSALDADQWNIVAHYIFLTYLHDHPGIDYCAYILFYAVPERGKSRTGKSVAYVSFRGIHLVELREATIFRYSQNIRGTLFFDLQDISKKAERAGCDDILLLRAEKGAKCCRVQHPEQGAFNDTVYYDIYGPTIIASNETLHKILETRCLPITMPNRPGDYENPRPEHALVMKERLTAWRAKHLNIMFESMEPVDGISGRLWDIAKPLFLVNRLIAVDSWRLKESILAIASEKDASKKESLEGRMVAIIKEITDENGLDQYVEWSIKISEIRKRFNEGRTEDKQVTSQWIGKRLKSMSFRNRIVKGYSEIQINDAEYETILNQHGYSSNLTATPPDTLPRIDKNNQDLTREVESCRESARERPSFNSPGEREYYDELVEQYQRNHGMTQEEATRRANKELEEWGIVDEIPF